MSVSQTETGSHRAALGIAMNYLVVRGYGLLEANEMAEAQIARLLRRGERRPLMLANLAIAAVEKDRQMEEERRSSTALRSSSAIE